MSMIARIGLAAAVSLAVVSHATAQKVKAPVKPFTAQEKLYFDRASVNTGGPSGGGTGGGGSD